MPSSSAGRSASRASPLSNCEFHNNNKKKKKADRVVKTTKTTKRRFKDGKEVGQHNGPRDVRPFVDWVRVQLPEIENFLLPGEEPREETAREEIVSDVINLTDETINEIKDGETWVFALFVSSLFSLFLFSFSSSDLDRVSL